MQRLLVMRHQVRLCLALQTEPRLRLPQCAVPYGCA
jgi:hypothetical protein